MEPRMSSGSFEVPVSAPLNEPKLLDSAPSPARVLSLSLSHFHSLAPSPLPRTSPSSSAFPCYRWFSEAPLPQKQELMPTFAPRKDA